MKQQLIEASAHSVGNVDQVWRLVTDIATWKEWGRWSEATIEEPDADERQGVGAIRRFKYGTTTSRERIIGVVAPRQFSYELLSGLPVRNYRGDVILTAAAAGGTDITWRSQFEGRFPGQGAVMRIMLGRFIKDAARRLARAAEISTTTPRR